LPAQFSVSVVMGFAEDTIWTKSLRFKTSSASFDPIFFSYPVRSDHNSITSTPPPTQTGLPSKLESKAISQLAKNESPSTCKIRLFLALTGNRHGKLFAPSVDPKLFTLAETEENRGFFGPVLGDGNA
jgi:hypothetical protein